MSLARELTGSLLVHTDLGCSRVCPLPTVSPWEDVLNVTEAKLP